MTNIPAPEQTNATRGTARLPAIYMPAMPPLGLIAMVRTRVQRIQRRRCMRRLLACPDRLIGDVGYTRGQVSWAADLPQSVDAGAAFIRHRRRQGASNRAAGTGCTPGSRNTVSARVKTRTTDHQFV